MTTQRFRFYQDMYEVMYVEDMQGDDIKLAHEEDMNPKDAIKVVGLLNDLHEEKEQLQSRINDYDVALKTLQDLTERKLKEYEQLKQFKEDVFNKIDMHLRMLPTARDNEFNSDDGDPSLYTGAIYMLETLKKELEE